jgi:hypothetical protein
MGRSCLIKSKAMHSITYAENMRSYMIRNIHYSNIRSCQRYGIILWVGTMKVTTFLNCKKSFFEQLVVSVITHNVDKHLKIIIY